MGIPGPTIRVTEGDLVRIRVINSNENSNPHSLHTHSIHYAKNDGVSMGGYPGGAISPVEVTLMNLLRSHMEYIHIIVM